VAEFESLDGGRLVSEVLRLLREGPGAGLRAVVTGDRTALLSRFSSLCERIVLLRLNDRATYGMAGLNRCIRVSISDLSQMHPLLGSSARLRELRFSPHRQRPT